MSNQRIFPSGQFFQPSDGEPIRSVVTQTADATIVAWYVRPGQSIKSHVHPNGQDTWTILSGKGSYVLTMQGDTHEICAGDVVVAKSNEVHGVRNGGNEPLIFISVVSPAEAGYELLEK